MAAVSSERPPAAGAGGLRDRVPGWLRREPWAWATLAACALNVLVLLEQLPRLLGNLYLNADVASAPVIASLIGRAPSGRVVTLGEYTWFEPLWFMRATAGLPAHRLIWELAPVLFSLAGLALVVWASWRTLGAWAAAMTAGVLACIGTVLRYVYFAPDAHGSTMVNGALLGATLVFLARSPRRPRTLALLAVPLAALMAAGATDLVLLVAGIVPFALAACALWLRTRSAEHARLALFAAAVSVAAAAGGALATHAMRADRIVHSPLLKLGFVENVNYNAEVLAKATSFLGSGYFFAARLSVQSALTFVAGALTLAAAGYVAVLLWRWARTLAARPAPADAAAAAREIHLTYWGLVGTAVIAAFMLSSQPFDRWSARYLVGAFVALAVLLPALLGDRRGARSALAVAIAAFGLLAVNDHLQERESTYDNGEMSVAQAHDIEAVARSQHLRYGYAEFWQAAPLIWNSHLRLLAYPVDRCHLRYMCPAAVHTISSWYEPRAHTRTFFVQYSRSHANVFPAAGPPVSEYRFGRLTMFVYDHDIAAQMGHSIAGSTCKSLTPCYGE